MTWLEQFRTANWGQISLTALVASWLATEGAEQGDDFLFFGYVLGLETEWGYFVLSELESVRGPGGLNIERDLHFDPRPFSEVIKKLGRESGQ